MAAIAEVLRIQNTEIISLEVVVCSLSGLAIYRYLTVIMKAVWSLRLTLNNFSRIKFALLTYPFRENACSKS